ncbi:ankyrin repeat domain-containing protein [Asticcacaulis taihuensis]|uniref:ankyrin repeat domain-containing protein n=1 Tax=Asticcacaulis taihuensis TaxID=260084 RepID=UPI0026E9B802|nr:ankyrin repeat domain-containing protein [Asticcacaulis taihuensis]
MSIKDAVRRTELHEAVIDQDHSKVRDLITAGVAVDAVDREGWTALHFAAQNQDAKSIGMLLESGASCNIQDSFGNTALFRAVFNYRGACETIELLLAAGALPDLANQSGTSPHQLANRIANYDAAKFFM